MPVHCDTSIDGSIELVRFDYNDFEADLSYSGLEQNFGDRLTMKKNVLIIAVAGGLFVSRHKCATQMTHWAISQLPFAQRLRNATILYPVVLRQRPA